MNKSIIITVILSLVFVGFIFFLASTSTKKEEEISVNSGYEQDYIPKIKKQKPPEPIAPELPKETKKEIPPISPPAIKLIPSIDPKAIINSKRANQELFVTKVISHKKEKTTPKTLLYKDDFDLEKNEAADPVRLDLVITADRFIPVILKTAISSSLPGQIIANVEENIYSSHNSNLLIPKGSSIFGEYESLERTGEDRLRIIWTRILTPQGVNINLTDSSAVDVQGKSGASGDLDNHLFERYGVALTLSTLTSALSYIAFKGTNPANTNEAQINNNLITNYKNDIAQITSQVLQENLKLAPIINLKVGQRLLIKNNLDLWFNKLDEKNIEVLIYKRSGK